MSRRRRKTRKRRGGGGGKSGKKYGSMFDEKGERKGKEVKARYKEERR